MGKKPDGAVFPYRFAKAHGEIGIVVENVIDTIGRENMEPEKRGKLPELRQARDQPAGGEGRGHGEAQFSLYSLAVEPRDRIAQLIERRVGGGEQLEPALGQRDAVAGANKEHEAPMVLKIGDMIRDRPMSHRKLVRSLAQMQMPGGGLESPKSIEGR